MPFPVHPPTHAECTGAMRSVRDALDLLGGKWKLPIIVGLSNGPQRFKQLQREVVGITAKMLSKELKELEINGLLTRHVQADTVPVAVTYTLASYGKTLFPVIEALHQWGQQHRTHIMHPGAAAMLEEAAG
ncbi:helix-turn-helix transcriptional regulator [Hymenobacter sp. BT186]|uniref:Helix-turn-helix transcriptional regulator n=1 Tax=Hymenobacter telluris TaxID=2816474 RepID=A0A939JC13_9BACT|nr:helix-turn-helix domain-containing protein [Hymenobacter telluris]MBO0357880.1 helix-turn-helix transcriptional regulator [Hymenobacter telluris]MBW3373907.1 helix-turn-helix transcriptional regulator [Hymenobacter norwichensis]